MTTPGGRYWMEHVSGIRAGPFDTDPGAWEWLTHQPFVEGHDGWACLYITDTPMNYREGSLSNTDVVSI